MVRIRVRALYPQKLSTGKGSCGYSFLVHIKYAAVRGRIPHFFAGGVFYYGGIFVQKFGLDRPVCELRSFPIDCSRITAGSYFNT